jgi:hypothetical protein
MIGMIIFDAIGFAAAVMPTAIATTNDIPSAANIL